MSQELTSRNFDAILKSSDVPVLVDFWAPWCGPCRVLGPILNQIEGEVGDKAKIYKVNVDKEPHLAQRFGIRGIPTVMLFDHGRKKQELVGVRRPDEYKRALGV